MSSSTIRYSWSSYFKEVVIQSVSGRTPCVLHNFKFDFKLKIKLLLKNVCYFIRNRFHGYYARQKLTLLTPSVLVKKFVRWHTWRGNDWVSITVLHKFVIKFKGTSIFILTFQSPFAQLVPEIGRHLQISSLICLIL